MGIICQRGLIGNCSCRLHGLTQEKVYLARYIERFTAVIIHFSSRPVRIARYAARTLMVFFEGSLKKGDSRFQQQRCLFIDTLVHLKSLILKTGNGFIEVFQDKAGHFIAGSPFAVFDKHVTLVGQHLFHDREITIFDKGHVITQRTKEIGFPNIMTKQITRSLDSSGFFFRKHLFEQIVPYTGTG